MADKQIYISVAEMEAAAKICRELGISYVRLDWTNKAIWHDIVVNEMPEGHSFKIPDCQEDWDSW